MFSITNHMWDGYWLVANKAWPGGKLPDAMKTIVARHIKDATMQERTAIRALNDSVPRRPHRQKGLYSIHRKSAPFRGKN